ncbi:hypothetical protein HDU88_002633 [Geranomyces variabilis]|nr:hypothetical protein HDU88_002633 [Geranomyces variabilis]
MAATANLVQDPAGPHSAPSQPAGNFQPDTANPSAPTGQKSSAMADHPANQQSIHDQDLVNLLNVEPLPLNDKHGNHDDSPLARVDSRNKDLSPQTTHTRHTDDRALPGAAHTDKITVQGNSKNIDDTLNSGAATVETSENTSESLIVVPTHYVFIFSNPKSGNQQGLPLVQMGINHYRVRAEPHVQVQLYDFLDEADRSSGLKYLNLLLNKQKSLKELHVWSAGGDGTLMGVVEGMIEMGIDVADDPRILFSVIPFGTGNDLSQVLGWGRYVSGTDVAGHHLEGLNKIVMDRLSGHKTLLDIWGVEIETEEGGWIREAGKEKVSTLRRKMSNYSSLGLQGRVGVGFEENRRGSRVLNAMEYSRQSLGVLVHGAPPVTNAVKALEAGGEYFDLEGKKSLRVTHEPIEMVIANIPGMWGRHVDLWGVADMSRSIIREQKGPTDLTSWTPHCAYDGKLEVFGIGSLRSYFRKQFSFGRKRLQRVGQMPSPFSVHFHEKSHIHAMIDGEFYETYGAKKMTYTRIMQIKLIGGHPDSSRLVSDLTNKVAELPGPTGEGVIPGVDFPVSKTEYAEETKGDKKERRMSSELIHNRSKDVSRANSIKKATSHEAIPAAAAGSSAVSSDQHVAPAAAR